jgi:diaminohydroxyphosphoribosylaminopyrimidine deaminase / 5-amino-6-(5-phosphoribosylamino)uracil reductase
LTDESYIKLAIEIAKKGAGSVSPNPLVGCVIIKDDRIIGAGYHEHFGGRHAEINAIENASEDVENSVLYVNLEPCSHYGKTPPCVDKIIEHKIKRVVIGTLDVNPLVSGKGIKKLKAAGIDVKVGVLEKECHRLNKFFFKYIIKQIPYVTLKAAETLDGKIADEKGNSKWISSLPSRKYVHNLRSEYDAVLVGRKTIEKDDPALNVRLVEGRNPKRVAIDSDLKLKTTLKLFKSNSRGDVILITSKKSAQKKRKIDRLNALGVKVIFVKENKDKKISLKNILEELGKLNIASLLVEGGREVFSSFIKENLFDDLLLFLSPKILGDGIPFVADMEINNIKEALKLKINYCEKIGDDVLIELSN